MYPKDVQRIMGKEYTQARRYLKKIKEHKPYVHCTLENTVPENAVATREFMERTYASV